jgi:hypothetical protein
MIAGGNVLLGAEADCRLAGRLLDGETLVTGETVHVSLMDTLLSLSLSLCWSLSWSLVMALSLPSSPEEMTVSASVSIDPASEGVGDGTRDMLEGKRERPAFWE